MKTRKKLGLTIGSVILGVSVLFNPITSTEASASAKTTTVQQNTKTYQTTANLNIRKGAGTSYALITTIPKGKSVTVKSSKKVGSSTWYQVTYGKYSGWVISTYLKQSNSVSSDKSSIANVAVKYIGSKYRFGGASPTGFDCSGYITYVLNQSGHSTTRKTAASFYNSTTRVSNPQVGDLVFFSNTYKAGVSHIGIYIGNNQMVHASNSGVKIDKVNSSYWSKHFTGYGRI